METTTPGEPPRVVYEEQSGVVTLTISRAEVRNAFDLRTWEELAAALDSAAESSSARAIVLTGGDISFSAGGDMGSMAERGASLLSPAQRLTAAQDVLSQLAALSVPVIAAVERYAIGTAWGLVLACDLVVAGAGAFFQGPFARRGLIADTGVGWQLARRIGHQRALRYLLLGERMPAPDALDLGLVTHVVEDGTATAEAQIIAAGLADGPAEANALTKSLVRRASGLSLADYLDAERVAFALIGHGRESREGSAAFAEKREPRFR